MKDKRDKPSPEAKALSLFLMAYKNTSPEHKKESRRISKLWSAVNNNELELKEYLEEVHITLDAFGGYNEVVGKTVKHYIDKTGKWSLNGDDQYCQDANAFAAAMEKK